MAAPLVTWLTSDSYVHGLSTASNPEKLTAIKNCVDANVLAHPTTAIWQVAASSIAVSGVNYLTLKRRDGSAGRIMIFGCTATAPNVNAVSDASALMTVLYCGYAMSPTGSAADTPDAPIATFTTDQPYLYWMRGCQASMNSSDYRYISYIESSAGILFMLRSGSDNTSLESFGAGDLLVDLADNPRPCSFGYSGTVAYNAAFDINVSTAGLLPAPNVGGYFEAGLTQRNATQWVSVNCYRAAGPLGLTTDSDRLYSEDLSQRYYLPIMVFKRSSGVNARGIAGRMRQIAFGSYGTRGQVILEAGTAAKMATGWSGSVSIPVPCLWCTEFAM